MSHHHEVSGKNLGLTILLNTTITICQIIGGIISGSMALMSDAVHNFSDVISLIISYIAHKLAKKEANERQTFGRKRSEIMAAFFNSATLIILSVYILIEAFKRFFTESDIQADWVIYLAALSIIINGISVLLIRNDAHKNMNMKSAYLHLFSDMLTSIAVLTGGLAMKYLHWYWVDPVLSIAIAIYLLYLSWDIFKNSIRILMQFTPHNVDIKEIVKKLNKIQGVKNLHHVHIWQLSDHDIIFESHVDLEDDIRISDFETIMEEIEISLHEFGIHHLTLQPEYNIKDNKDIIAKHIVEKRK